MFDAMRDRKYMVKKGTQKRVILYPNGRNDVAELEKWYKLMVGRMDDMEVKTLKDYFDYCQFVYGACIKELIK